MVLAQPIGNYVGLSLPRTHNASPIEDYSPHHRLRCLVACLLALAPIRQMSWRPEPTPDEKLNAKIQFLGMHGWREYCYRDEQNKWSTYGYHEDTDSYSLDPLHEIILKLNADMAKPRWRSPPKRIVTGSTLIDNNDTDSSSSWQLVRQVLPRASEAPGDANRDHGVLPQHDHWHGVGNIDMGKVCIDIPRANIVDDPWELENFLKSMSDTLFATDSAYFDTTYGKITQAYKQFQWRTMKTKSKSYAFAAICLCCKDALYIDWDRKSSTQEHKKTMRSRLIQFFNTEAELRAHPDFMKLNPTM